ncbi:Phosphopantetheine attachment site [Lentzea aerocolonigenes]|nr:Phosphopantetheine attachment site [Lentzea aerocolonigenes]
MGTMTHDTGELMSVVAHTMGDVLLRAPLAPTEDFFDCGGDSMRAVEVLSRLIERYGPAGEEAVERLRSELLTVIFDDASPAALASVIVDHSGIEVET